MAHGSRLDQKNKIPGVTLAIGLPPAKLKGTEVKDVGEVLGIIRVTLAYNDCNYFKSLTHLGWDGVAVLFQLDKYVSTE